MADSKRSALGKGLSALIPETPEPDAGVTELDVERIVFSHFAALEEGAAEVLAGLASRVG